MRKTKIVCTVGPASGSLEIVKQLLESGMDVARLNFSHGTHEEQAARLATLRYAAAEMGKCLAIMLDTKGRDPDRLSQGRRGHPAAWRPGDPDH